MGEASGSRNFPVPLPGSNYERNAKCFPNHFAFQFRTLVLTDLFNVADQWRDGEAFELRVDSVQSAYQVLEEQIERLK